MPSPIDFPLYLITDRHSLPEGRTLEAAVHAALDGGVRAVQLREKDLDEAEFRPLAEKMRRLTADYGARLLINDRVALAREIGADGVHLGGHSRPTAEVRRLLDPGMLIGVSTHFIPEIAAAAEQGADFVTFGPVYHTPSKAPLGTPVGLRAVQQACTAALLPVFALGGVRLERLAELLAAGVYGIGLIGAIQNAPDPAEAARAINRSLEAGG